MKKILIIDDEEGFTEMVKLNLEDTGKYEVVVENFAVKAYNTVLSCKPDLILLDIIMPLKEGPDILNQLRGCPQTQDIPVVFLTATIRPEEVEQENGFVGGHPFLAKPTSINDLIEMIEKNLR